MLGYPGLEYLGVLLERDAPARLVAVATRELVEPSNPVPAVRTVLSGGNDPSRSEP